MKARRAILGCALLLAAALAPWRVASAANAGADNNSSTYTGAGWTLTLTGSKATYNALAGTLRYRGHHYHTSGDWIPAADAGGFLLRFYGHPFSGSPFVGLVSVATLYNTCIPNCAAGRTFALKALADWTLPGTQLHSVHLTLK